MTTVNDIMDQRSKKRNNYKRCKNNWILKQDQENQWKQEFKKQGIEYRGKLQAMQKEYQKTMKHGEMTKRPKKNKLNRKATINS